MDTKFQTSFIPKQPVTVSASRTSSAGTSIFLLISVIIFIASIVLAGGLYLYDQKLNADIANGNKQLTENENSFQSVTLDSITRLNDRINSINVLLKKHISFSNFFGELAATTLQNVRFSNFSYIVDTNGKINVSMNGQATSYETVALQAQAFSDPSLQGMFQNVLFSNLNLDNSGNITFGLTMNVNPVLVSYYKSVQNGLISGPATTTNPTQ